MEPLDQNTSEYACGAQLSRDPDLIMNRNMSDRSIRSQLPNSTTDVVVCGNLNTLFVMHNRLKRLWTFD